MIKSGKSKTVLEISNVEDIKKKLSGLKILEGKQGVSISDISLTEENNLLVSLSDKRKIEVELPEFPKGQDGGKGDQGDPGIGITRFEIVNDYDLKVELSNKENRIIENFKQKPPAAIKDISAEDGRLKFKMSDGKEILTCKVPTVKGKDGDKGDPGAPGTKITNVSVSEDNRLVVVTDDGEFTTTKPLKTAKGEKGDPGRSISDIRIDKNNILYFTIGDKEIAAGQIQTLQGLPGDQGDPGVPGEKGEDTPKSQITKMYLLRDIVTNIEQQNLEVLVIPLDKDSISKIRVEAFGKGGGGDIYFYHKKESVIQKFQNGHLLKRGKDVITAEPRKSHSELNFEIICKDNSYACIVVQGLKEEVSWTIEAEVTRI